MIKVLLYIAVLMRCSNLFCQVSDSYSSQNIYTDYKGDSVLLMIKDYSDSLKLKLVSKQFYFNTDSMMRPIGDHMQKNVNDSILFIYKFSRDSLNVKRSREDYIFFADDRLLDSVMKIQHSRYQNQQNQVILSTSHEILRLGFEWFPNGSVKKNVQVLKDNRIILTYYLKPQELLFEKEYVFSTVFINNEVFNGWVLDGPSTYFLRNQSIGIDYNMGCPVSTIYLSRN